MYFSYYTDCTIYLKKSIQKQTHWTDKMLLYGDVGNGKN